MKRNQLILFFVAILLFAGCKKVEGPAGPAGEQGTSGKDGKDGQDGKDGPTGPPGPGSEPDARIYNRWEIISGLPNTRYIVVGTDKSLNFLNQDTTFFGITLTTSMALFTKTQLWVNNTIFNYTISETGDTLMMKNLQYNILLIKNDAAPAPQDWVKTVTPLDSLATPENIGTEMGWDGQDILFGSGDTSTRVINKINPITGNFSVLNLSVIHDVVTAVEMQNGDVLLNRTNYIFRTDASTGVVKQVLPTAFANYIYGLAWTGSDLWVWSDDNSGGFFPPASVLYRTDVNGVVQQSYSFPNNYSWGMEYVNGHLYLCSGGNYLYKCTTNPLQVVKTYRMSRGNTWGITHDGANFWVSGYVGNAAKLYKVALD